MLFLDMLIWWYGPGWVQRLGNLKLHLSNWMKYFSLGILLRTLFQPWKQIVSVAGNGTSLEAKKNALLDNMVSRFVGFLVRSSVFFVALLVVGFVLIANVLYVIVWPLIPILPIVAIIWGLV